MLCSGLRIDILPRFLDFYLHICIDFYMYIDLCMCMLLDFYMYIYHDMYRDTPDTADLLSLIHISHLYSNLYNHQLAAAMGKSAGLCTVES